MYVPTAEEINDAVFGIALNMITNEEQVKADVTAFGEVLQSTSAHETNHTFVELVKNAETEEEAVQILDTILIVGYHIRETIYESKQANVKTIPGDDPAGQFIAR